MRFIRSPLAAVLRSFSGRTVWFWQTLPSRHTILATLILLGQMVSASDAGEDTQTAALQKLQRQWQRLEPPTPNMAARDLFSFTLEAVAQDWMPEYVERALELAEQMQDRNPQSRTYGNFKWYWGSERPIDRNAVEFCMQKGVLVWSQFHDRLTPASIERLKRLFQYSVEGIRRQRVSVSYTNIFLMKIWNCIAIGEATERSDFADEGYQMLDQWLRYTWENGIHEYDSPTYYGVDLDSLGLIARFAKSPEGRRSAEVALQLFWTDIAANWFAPCARLGGAHSRDYDYLTGHGYLANHLRAAGWIGDGPVPSQGVFFELCHWQPPRELFKQLTRRTPRTVHQRWGASPGQTATLYVGRRFTIGSSGANYGPMDKSLVVNFAKDERTPMVHFFMDGRNDPYGKRKFSQPSGHRKALHLTPFVTSVQRDSDVLLLAAADPTTRSAWRYSTPPVCLLSHLVLPSAVQLWIGDMPAGSQGARQRIRVAANGPVFLRFQDVVVGVRWLLALDPQGQPAELELANDGIPYGARRLTCIHASTLHQSGYGVTALWLRGVEGMDDAEFAQFRYDFAAAPAATSVNGSIVDVSVPHDETTLHLKADVARGERLVVEGAQHNSETCLLAVDDRDLGREILSRVDCIARHQQLLTAAQTGRPEAPRAEQRVEAEEAPWIIAPFRIADDADASGGRFLWVPGEPGQAGSGPTALANWLLHIPQKANYYLWARLRTPTPADDSFYVQITQGEHKTLPRIDWHTGVHRQWQWVPFSAGKEHDSQPILLESGAASLSFFGREDGAALDCLLLTTDPDWQAPAR